MLIVHRCNACRQPDYWHDRDGRKTTAGDKVDGKTVPDADRRTCCGRRADWGAPETAPRWKTLTYEPIAEALQPGSKTDSSMAAATSCDCDDCWALWMQLTGATRRPRHLAAVPA